MRYDYIVRADEVLNQECFHLSCGFYETTSFLFEGAGFYVNIHYKGAFTFYRVNGEKLETATAKPMTSGRGCYTDILVTTTEDAVIFQLPEYAWNDHYPHCDGESDRWTAKITGVRDEIRFPYQTRTI